MSGMKKSSIINFFLIISKLVFLLTVPPIELVTHQEVETNLGGF